MTECEVCLEPDAEFTITVTAPDTEPCAIDFCRDCTALVFGAMVVRYKAAVEGQRKSMREFYRILGIEVPS